MLSMAPGRVMEIKINIVPSNKQRCKYKMEQYSYIMHDDGLYIYILLARIIIVSWFMVF